jgi:phenylpropionate dioxygenase-like ring-hydroxylating dioxygenase large terminal subunit
VLRTASLLARIPSWLASRLPGKSGDEETVFDGFAHVWTIVGLARELERDAPLPLVVAGERVVMFRGRDGAPAALIDRCPHRGVALSLGQVENGEIRCPFHGWRFGPDGCNLYTPWNPDAKRKRLGAIALPVRERDGVLWLRTAPGAASEEPPPIDSLARGLRLCAQSFHWRAHWTRVMENMLDSPHVAFVHRRTFGGPIARMLAGRPDARMDIDWEPHAHGAMIAASVEGEPRPAALNYVFPDLMELTLDFRGRLFRLLAVCIPVAERETRLTLITARGFLRPPLFDFLFNRVNRRIAEEDRAIVESSIPPWVPLGGEEVSVRTDAATLAFRRLYRERLLGSRATLSDGADSL